MNLKRPLAEAGGFFLWFFPGNAERSIGLDDLHEGPPQFWKDVGFGVTENVQWPSAVAKFRC